MRQILTIVIALFAGFLGGIIGSRVDGARERSIVRAHSFELLNDAGEAISFWGIDNIGQTATLAFGSRGRGLAGSSGHDAPGGITNPDNQLISIGLASADEPVLRMRGPDGKPRVRLYVTPYGKSSLLMDDETGTRMLLGVEQSDTPGPEDNNWSLLFLPERARIGMGTVTENGQTYLMSTFFLSKDKVRVK